MFKFLVINESSVVEVANCSTAVILPETKLAMLSPVQGEFHGFTIGFDDLEIGPALRTLISLEVTLLTPEFILNRDFLVPDVLYL